MAHETTLYYPDTRHIPEGQEEFVDDPNLSATYCCGKENQGVHQVEDVHRCIRCGKRYAKQKNDSKEVKVEIIDLQIAKIMLERLRSQGLEDEFLELNS